MRAVFSLLSALLLLAVSSVAAQSSSAFEPAPCPDSIAATECGYVSVPENHANPDGPQIRLAVAIARAESAAPDPLFFLAGGPGEDGLAYSIMSQFITDRDVVVFDQRGAGRSEPVLACPEYNDAILASATSTGAETNAALINAIIARGERMTAEASNLRFLTPPRALPTSRPSVRRSATRGFRYSAESSPKRVRRIKARSAGDISSGYFVSS